jgi:hypothetical protein
MKHSFRWNRAGVALATLGCVLGTSVFAAEPDLAARLEKGGLAPDRARQLAGSVTAAERAGLPVVTVVSRIDEGLAKQVPADAMERAIQTRLDALKAAQGLLAGAGYTDLSVEPARQLLSATAMATESGVPADDLRAVLTRAQGRAAMRLASVVGAGESLHLAGFAPPATRALMIDCIDRNLGRMEILRAVNHCIQQKRAGRSDDEIRAALWGPATGTNDTFRGHGGMRNGQGRGG